MPRSKAAVFVGPNKPFEVREFPVPEIAPNSALIRMVMSGICATDSHARHHPDTLYPVIMGHENIGVIEKLGREIRADALGEPLKEGDRVLFGRAECGRCAGCTMGEGCLTAKGYGFNVFTETVSLTGGFSEYLVLHPNPWVIRVPDDMSTERALVSVVGNHTVMNCLDKIGGIKPADTVVVQGSGPVGMGGVTQAKLAGAGTVIVIGAPARRLELAREIGADEVISIQEFNEPAARVEKVKELTGGRGADVVIECSGARTAFQEGMDMARRGGKFAVVGQWTDYGPMPINPSTVTRKQLLLGGVAGPRTHCIVRSVQAMRTRVPYPVEKLITHQFPLAQVNEAFQAHESLEAMVAVLRP